MSSKTLVVMAAALTAAALAFLRRPVRPPESDGSWHPAETTPSRH